MNCRMLRLLPYSVSAALARDTSCTVQKLERMIEIDDKTKHKDGR